MKVCGGVSVRGVYDWWCHIVMVSVRLGVSLWFYQCAKVSVWRCRCEVVLCCLLWSCLEDVDERGCQFLRCPWVLMSDGVGVGLRCPWVLMSDGVCVAVSV